MRRLALIVALVVVAAPTALAGGWATVGLSSLPPKDLAAGEAWPVEITVLQHGRTPLAGVRPSITIRDLKTGAVAGTFEATPTARTGVYRTAVSFPRAGTWGYEVYDGFTAYGNAETHHFKPVTIGGGADATRPWLLAVAGGGALTLLGLAVLVLRRRRTTPELRPVQP